jgi:hypothetical protein
MVTNGTDELMRGRTFDPREGFSGRHLAIWTGVKEETMFE